MRIGLLNDTHAGIGDPRDHVNLFRALASENPDVITHAGDFCGGSHGFKHVRATTNILREMMPNIPIVAVIGNHDYWVPKLTLNNWLLNYKKIEEIFRTNRIHFLDIDGPFRKDGVCITGASGWYATKPTTNDWKYIPETIHGDSQNYFQKKKQDILERNLQFTDEDKIRIYLSHFPVIDCNPWDDYPSGERLKSLFNINYFISGHSHSELNGPVHFRTGSDYSNSKYKIITI